MAKPDRDLRHQRTQHARDHGATSKNSRQGSPAMDAFGKHGNDTSRLSFVIESWNGHHAAEKKHIKRMPLQKKQDLSLLLVHGKDSGHSKQVSRHDGKHQPLTTHKGGRDKQDWM